MTEQERIAAALAYQGATAAPPTMAQQLAKVPSRLVGALKALGTGSSYGSAEPVNAVNDLARTKFWRGSVFGVPEDVQERNLARAMEAVSMAAPIVYHGSPHRFVATAKNPLGEFDPTKIGTGEGAQAYGYGHYVAESPNVAKDYQTTISKDKFLTSNGLFDPSSLEHLNVRAEIRKGNLNKAIETAQKYASPDADYPEVAAKAMRDLQKLEQLRASGGIRTNQGNLYKVDLPDEAVARMLDWDKPFNQQPAEVKSFLSKVSFNLPKDDQIIGEWLAPRLKEGMSSYWADDMRKANIPGIKYLDEGSRAKGEGTRNFVVFPGNEGLLNILGRE
jgi:hypothetical protein